MLKQGIKKIQWPEKSPDFNIIKSVWDMMTRRVYKHHNKFKNVANFKAEIIEMWEDLNGTYFQQLYRTRTRRVWAGIDEK